MKQIILLSIFLLSVWNVYPQTRSEPCGYQPDSQYLNSWKNPNSIPKKRLEFLKKFPVRDVLQIQTLEYRRGKYSLPATTTFQGRNVAPENRTGTIRVTPIVAHIIRRSNGTGGISVLDLNTAIATANSHFSTFNFKLNLCAIRFIDSDELFTNRYANDDDDLGNSNASYTVLDVSNRNAARSLNIYFVPVSNTSWTWRPNRSPNEQHILMNNSHATNSRTLSHEIGHWFDLIHTHGNSNDELTEELVNGSNCETAGDFLCDTPADPKIDGKVNQSCQYTGTDIDANGDTFSPDPRNFMSYAGRCRNRFSNGQIYRMQSSFLGMREDRGYTFTTCATPKPAFRNFCYNQGWRIDRHPRMIGDVNGDGRADIIGFANAAVIVALGQKNGTFKPAQSSLRNFCYNQGWRVGRHPRMLGDVNGDGRTDIVGFAQGAVTVALGQKNGTFKPAPGSLKNFCYKQGWRVDKHPRMLGDVNGDGRADIIGFAQAGVYVTLGQKNGTFKSAPSSLKKLCYRQGWRVGRHPRMLGDVNGDGRVDIVGFGQGAVTVALGQQNGNFKSMPSTLKSFCYQQGWRVDKHPRMLGDINGDGRADIIGFAQGDIYVRLGQKNGTFKPAPSTMRNLCYRQGWRVGRHPRMLGDFTADGRDDIVGFGQEAVFVATGNPDGRLYGIACALKSMCYGAGNWRVEKHPRMLGDVNGDGNTDIIGFGQGTVFVVDGNDLKNVID